MSDNLSFSFSELPSSGRPTLPGIVAHTDHEKQNDFQTRLEPMYSCNYIGLSSDANNIKLFEFRDATIVSNWFLSVSTAGIHMHDRIKKGRVQNFPSGGRQAPP